MNPSNENANDKIKIVFMGTPDFAVPALTRLIEAGYTVSAVVTQPDRPKGRKRVLTPSPVKEAANQYGIAVLQPERIKHETAIEALRQINPDLIVTAAYGQILPKAILDMPRLGCVNLHASLLPKYRGAAPIHYAVINGDSETGVTLMYMDVGMDTGDMIAKTVLPICENDNTGILFEKLSIAGADLLIKTLPSLIDGTVKAIPQAEAEATYAPMLKREDELIKWDSSARDIANLVRGLNPWPGAYTLWEGKVMKIWACKPWRDQLPSSPFHAKPGTVLSLEEDGFTVKTKDGAVLVTEVQPFGKKAMPAKALIAGGRLAPGQVLGEQAQV